MQKLNLLQIISVGCLCESSMSKLGFHNANQKCVNMAFANNFVKSLFGSELDC